MQDNTGSRPTTDGEYQPVSPGPNVPADEDGIFDATLRAALADTTSVSSGTLAGTAVSSMYETRLDCARTATATQSQHADEQRETSATTDDADDGHVSLIGSGPGHPGLLTRLAWERLDAADVVLHDSLTGDAIVAALPPTAEVVDVGKRPPDRTSQDEINELMRDRARAGEHVARLKGGDPNVFGRGGEEAEYLADHEIAFEVVSGISSVLAASGVSGIPLTHRDCSSSLTVITGHQTPDKDESRIDWEAIAGMLSAGGTLVILMGVSKLPENVAALREQDVADDTAVAMVEKVTWEDERTITGTLETIVDECRQSDIEPPAVTIVGDVVDVRERVEPHLS